MDQRTVELDVLLREGETPEGVRDMLAERFGAAVNIAAEQPCAATTYTITGTDRQIRGIQGWYRNDGRPRPDLRGVPPVAKGQRRTPPPAAEPDGPPS